MAFADWMQLFADVHPSAPKFKPENYSDLKGKVYIVTGGPTGVGFQVSRLLASKNAKVYLAARNQSKIDEAIEKIKVEFPKAEVDYLITDLSNLATIKPGIQKFLDQETRLDGLVLNAGVMTPPPGSTTKQGHELQLGTNCIGHWLVAQLLQDVLIKTARFSPPNSVRMLWVASSGHMMANHYGLNFPDPAAGGKFELYGQSKAVNIQQAIILGERLKSEGIVVVSCHPGVLNSELQRHSGSIAQKLGACLLHDPVYGAYTELFCMLSPVVTTKDSGRYAIPWGKFGRIVTQVEENGKGEAGAKLEGWLNEKIEAFL